MHFIQVVALGAGINVCCVIGPSLLNQQQQTEHDRWLNRSTSLANAGAKLIVWSEETGSASSPKEEADLLEKARDLALEKQVYLALTYDKDDETNILENKLVLVTPKGEIAINYNKAHPVPFVEPQPAKKEEIQYVDTPEFGRVGAAICFDYNFPWYIRQASRHNVDVMLQASWTWGPIGTYHANSNSLRAVENGITVLRCGSQSLSGVFEPTLNGIFSQQVAVTNDAEYLFYLPIQKRSKTLYGFTGDLFGFSCLALGSAATLYLIYDAVVKYRRGGQIQV
ncbi:carbon-nitrogen hydrolase [Zychaea mexicana]|uniref:carbon-nitrogen hydrolase n=1 Tax=Zychaea mexicana TaxID=64656 RepID=UPI0022FE254D|nr:carbon-nitrogen hydrolase [Zychaea mexicana]KAI9482636.1 carbon-nitrogen hydrolase [Zychaea mexicana]